MNVSDWLTWVNGFRWVGLKEQIDIPFTSPASGPVNVGLGTTNNLYGWQTGIDVLLLNREMFEVNFLGRAGIYGNDLSSSVVLTSPTMSAQAKDSESAVAFVGEVELNSALHLTECMSLFAGYRVLFLEGVAVASDSVAVGGLPANTGGTAIFHGGLVGLQGTF